jgi:hypothetical protein
MLINNLKQIEVTKMIMHQIRDVKFNVSIDFEWYKK